jgi:CPA1 family monovalent cation:H+ antiporter
MTSAEFDARMRVQSYAVWGSVVFTLNVFAFLLMGMQARSIVMRLEGSHLREALGFAGLVILAVICTRLFVVLGFSRLEAWRECSGGAGTPGTLGESFFVGWCGMRGFVTIAAAFALPVSFPHRDTVVLTAFSVVLATLVLQGLTLAPIVRLFKLDRTDEATSELASARVVLAEVALSSIEDQQGPEADNLRYRLSLNLQNCINLQYCNDDANVVSLDRIRDLGLKAIESQRDALETLRADDSIGPTEYLGLQEQLDWHELTLLRDADRQIEEI